MNSHQDVLKLYRYREKKGTFVIDKNSFNNVNREYNLASVFRKNDSFIGNVRVLVDWLSSVSGYARLEDSYEPEYFRLAMFRAGGQLPNFYDKATAMIVRFECKPQRFLKTGEIPIEYTPSDFPNTESYNNKSYQLFSFTRDKSYWWFCIN